MKDVNQLKYLEEFQKVLADYSVSSASQSILKQTTLVLLTAPTSVGRNTVIRELLKTGDYHFIVSDTTRQPRVQDGILEQNGIHYWFRGESEVLEDLKTGSFLEAAVIHNQQVSGISVRELAVARDENRIGITDIEIVGAANIVRAKPDTIAVFLLPPNFEEWQRRITKRGNMHGAEYRRRMTSALNEFEAALSNDYYCFVVNNTVEQAAEEIHQIARFDVKDLEKQTAGRRLAEQLYAETRQLLANQ